MFSSRYITKYFVFLIFILSDLTAQEIETDYIVVANHIQDFFVKDLNRKDRKVKQAGFLVLRNTYMPSVLIEAGFLTNKREGKYLNSMKGQKEVAFSKITPTEPMVSDMPDILDISI